MEHETIYEMTERVMLMNAEKEKRKSQLPYHPNFCRNEYGTNPCWACSLKFTHGIDLASVFGVSIVRGEQ